MCLLHDADDYGVLYWPLHDIASAAGAPKKLIKELVDKSVLKGSDKEITEPYIYIPRSGRKDGEPVTLIPVQPGPLWYSSRMVKDEYIRKARGQSSRFGEGNSEASLPSPIPPFGEGKGDTPKTVPKPPLSDGSSSSSSSSYSSSKNKEKINKKESFDFRAYLKAKGVSDQVVDDWATLRKTKKAPITQTAIDEIEREAVKARISLETALSKASAGGWQGFRAAWVKDDGQGSCAVGGVSPSEKFRQEVEAHGGETVFTGAKF